ncbi:hypothetical protein KC351_g8584 [Hortaea werneckii]|nr:hypothetical protein KC351_g8584 [Hortaea werneckii]
MTSLFITPYGYWDPPPTMVDHPHERLHQHNSLLGAMAHKKPDPKMYPNRPDVDISDATDYYMIDIELPGVKDANTIRLHWLSWTSLIVSGESNRPWNSTTPSNTTKTAHSDSKLKPSESETSANTEIHMESADLAQTNRAALPPHLLIGERRIGAFRREFHFPVEVDVDKVDAKLEAGLLRIQLPKKLYSYPKGSHKINVQASESGNVKVSGW